MERPSVHLFNAADRYLEQRLLDLEDQVRRLELRVPCQECGMIGTHLGTCSKSAMNGVRRCSPFTHFFPLGLDGGCVCGTYGPRALA